MGKHRFNRRLSRRALGRKVKIVDGKNRYLKYRLLYNDTIFSIRKDYLRICNEDYSGSDETPPSESDENQQIESSEIDHTLMKIVESESKTIEKISNNVEYFDIILPLNETSRLEINQNINDIKKNPCILFNLRLLIFKIMRSIYSCDDISTEYLSYLENIFNYWCYYRLKIYTNLEKSLILLQAVKKTSSRHYKYVMYKKIFSFLNN